MSDDLTQAPSDSPGSEPVASAASGYTIGPEIARGGMGLIHRGRDRALDREVAIKILQDRYPVGSITARRFLEEARITGQLQHPGIPPIHHVGTLPDGRPFLAMKLVKGRTLETILQDRDGTNCLAVFEAVCQAVGYAHAHGVVHRDLKPANIMVGSFAEVQVMDWGLAKVLGASATSTVADDPNATTALGTAIRRAADSTDDVTQDGDVLGTPAYMPPEQALGAVDDVDERSDVFGLGAILCAILTGRPPFVGGDAKSTRQLAAKGKLDDAYVRLDASGADPEWIALAKRCLSAEKEHRPANANAVAAEAARLRAEAEDRAKRAELDGERARVRAEELRKRRRVQAALAGAVMLLLVAGVGFAWWLDHQAEERKAATVKRDLDEQYRKSGNAVAVLALLERGEAALREGDTETAALAIDQARRRAGEGGAEEWDARLARDAADLTLLNELNAIDEYRWSPLPESGIYPSPEDVLRRFRAALEPVDLVPNRDRVEAMAVRLSDSPLRSRVLDIYDRMIWVERSADALAVLARVDADPFRDRFRAAAAKDDRATIVALAGTPAFLAQPVGFLGIAAWASPLPEATRSEVHRQVVLRWPNNPNVLVNAGAAIPYNRRSGADERLRWFQASLAAAPKSLHALNGIGLALHNRGDDDEAILYFREAIRLNAKVAVTWNNLGIAQRDLGRRDDARASFEESIRLDPGNAQPYRNLGTLAQAVGDRTAARTHYEAALRANPRYALAMVDLAGLDRQDGQRDRALERYRRAIETDPELAQGYEGLGHIRLDLKDYDGALESFRKASELDPLTNSLPYLRGLVQLRKDGPAAAVASFREAAQLRPSNETHWIMLANALRDSGRSPDAIATYREAIERLPKAAALHNNLGLLYRDAGQLDEAAAAFERAIERSPRSPIPLRNLGSIYVRRNQSDPAIAKFLAALALDPNYVDAWIELGFCRKRQRDFDAALVCFDRAATLNPRYGAPWYNIGDLRKEQGDLYGAVRCFEAAIQRDPRHAASINSLAWILAAGPIEFRDAARARDLATNACELSNGTEPNFLDTLAVAHAAAGDFETAIATQDRALNVPNIEQRGGPQMRVQRDLFRRGQPYTESTMRHVRPELAPIPREATPR